MRAFSLFALPALVAVPLACASGPEPRPAAGVVASRAPLAVVPAAQPRGIVDVGEIQANPTYPSDATAFEGAELGMASVPIAALPTAAFVAWGRFAPVAEKYHRALADERSQRDWMNVHEDSSPEALQDLMKKHRARLSIQIPYVHARNALLAALEPPHGKAIDAPSAVVLGWLQLEMAAVPPLGIPPSSASAGAREVAPELPEAALDTPAEEKVRAGYRTRAMELFDFAKNERLATESVGWFARYELALHHEPSVAALEWRSLVAESDAKHLGEGGARTLFEIAGILERAFGWVPERVKALRDATQLATDASDKMRLSLRWMTAAAQTHDWPGCVEAAHDAIAAAGPKAVPERDLALRGAALCLDHEGGKDDPSLASFGESAAKVKELAAQIAKERAGKDVRDRVRDFADECMYLRGKKPMKLMVMVEVQDGAAPRATVTADGGARVPRWVAACVDKRAAAYFTGAGSGARAVVAATVGE